jgi:putative redox protein
MGKTLALILFYTPSLPACTLSTLRMYIEKGWDIPEINISLNFYQESDPELTTISRSIRFPTEIEDEFKSDY